MNISHTRCAGVVAATLCAACDVSTALEYSARVAPEVLAQAARYEARFIEDAACEDLELQPGRIDRALTATAALRFTSPTPDGFAPVDLSPYSGDLAMDLRAIAGDGTPLGRRCTPVASTTEAAIVALARFADPGSSVRRIQPIALSAGAAQRPGRVQVIDMAGAPAPRVFASLGADRPLLVSDAMGFIDVKTSSVTLDAGTTRALVVFGVVGSQTVITAEALGAPTCPEPTWSREIVPGLAGAQIALASADAGPRTLIAMLRPRDAISALNTVEMLAADESATSLRSLTTATTAASGLVAIAADRTTGAATVMVVREGVAELRDFDGANNRLGAARTATLGVTVGGSIDGVRGAWLPGRGARFVAFGDVPSGAVELTAAGVVTPLVATGDRAIVDLALDPDGAALTTDAGLERFVRVDGVLQPDGAALASMKGRVLTMSGGRARHLTLDGTALTTAGEAGVLDTVAVPSAPLSLAAGDLNGDGVDDLLLVASGGARLVAASTTGRLVPAAECAVMGGPRTVIALPLDRGGRARWASVLDQTGRLALWVQP